MNIWCRICSILRPASANTSYQPPAFSPSPRLFSLECRKFFLKMLISFTEPHHSKLWVISKQKYKINIIALVIASQLYALVHSFYGECACFNIRPLYLLAIFCWPIMSVGKPWDIFVHHWTCRKVFNSRVRSENESYSRSYLRQNLKGHSSVVIFQRRNVIVANCKFCLRIDLVTMDTRFWITL